MELWSDRVAGTSQPLPAPDLSIFIREIENRRGCLADFPTQHRRVPTEVAPKIESTLSYQKISVGIFMPVPRCKDTAEWRILFIFDGFWTAPRLATAGAHGSFRASTMQQTCGAHISSRRQNRSEVNPSSEHEVRCPFLFTVHFR